MDRLQAKLRRLEAELVKKDKVIDILGKTHALLEALTESATSETKHKDF